MQRLRSSGMLAFMPARILKKQATNAWSSVQDTFYSTKDVFERHRVIFTVSTSIASVATAWAGYSIRVYHQSRVENRLDSIEQALKEHAQLGKTEIKKMVNSGSTAASLATAGTTFLVGYGLGWRGGRWQARRQFRREQMKLLGQLKPKRWQLLAGIKPKGLQLLAVSWLVAVSSNTVFAVLLADIGFDAGISSSRT
uniref:Uncharacterized protein n=1 Tax=Kalanchoe fedtschenkoi TaxID=63787 RepID=A0A7N0RJW3_KALFE